MTADTSDRTPWERSPPAAHAAERDRRGDVESLGPPPCVEGGIHPLIKKGVVVAAVGLAIALAIRHLVTPITWHPIAVVGGFAAFAGALIRTYRLRADEHGIERRVLGLVDHWTWSEFHDGSLRDGGLTWEVTRGPILHQLRHRLTIAWAEAPAGQGIAKYAHALHLGSKALDVEKSEQFRTFALGRVRIDADGIHMRGGRDVVPWSEVDGIGMELKTPDAPRLDRLTIRTPKGTGTITCTAAPAHRSGGRLLRLIRAYAPASLVIEWCPDISPRSEAEWSRQRASLIRRERTCTIGLLFCTGSFVFVVGTFGRRIVGGIPGMMDDGLARWLTASAIALGVVMLLF